MSTARVEEAKRRLRTPRAAAVAGILFAVLYTTAQVLLLLALPEGPEGGGAALANQSGSIALALSLVPYSGLAFLWFIGVIRDLIGEYEDRFFATVFLGSGLLYLGLVFVAAALAGGLLASYAADPQLLGDSVFSYARRVMHQITNIYGLRMSGVFMISFATVMLRTGVMPRWVAFSTYILALILLLSISLNPWLKLLFPLWVFGISLLILIQNYRRSEEREDYPASSISTGG
jgi:hypothetical protein